MLNMVGFKFVVRVTFFFGGDFSHLKSSNSSRNLEIVRKLIINLRENGYSHRFNSANGLKRMKIDGKEELR